MGHLEQTVGSSQGLYQHRKIKHTHTKVDMYHAMSRIQTHGPSDWEIEVSLHLTYKILLRNVMMFFFPQICAVVSQEIALL
jgi:hypothetical protein